MRKLQWWRGLRAWQRATVLAGVVVAGLAAGAMTVGAAAKPTMQVLPSPTGVRYSQTVEVKAKNLPKGSGTIAVTICGLDTAGGQKIATPTADDCAGANDLNSGLVKLQQWKDGTFDQQYTLPKSGQKFAKNQRFCDHSHYCALVVADANPSNPAYYISTELQFTDQKPTSGPTTTTKPKSKTTTTTTKPTIKATTTTTTTTRPTLSIGADGSASAGPNGGSGSGGASVGVNPPSASLPPITTPPITLPPVTFPGLPGAPANPVPPQAGAAVTQACAQLAQVIKQGGGDPTTLTIACSTLVNGGSGAQLALLLQTPSLGCVATSTLPGDNPQLADACTQLAAALQPYSSQLGNALSPVLGSLP